MDFEVNPTNRHVSLHCRCLGNCVGVNYWYLYEQTRWCRHTNMQAHSFESSVFVLRPIFNQCRSCLAGFSYFWCFSMHLEHLSSLDKRVSLLPCWFVKPMYVLGGGGIKWVDVAILLLVQLTLCQYLITQMFDFWCQAAVSFFFTVFIKALVYLLLPFAFAFCRPLLWTSQINRSMQLHVIACVCWNLNMRVQECGLFKHISQG